jgi:isopenicillin-N epimerase
MASAPLQPAMDLSRAKARLYDEFQIEVPLIKWNGNKLIRVSVQGYNSPADLKRLIEALNRLT